MELNLVLLGPPGAGKGTQARQLRKRWNIPHISTGAMLREAVQAGTPLGREVGAIMESGGLIDDDVITRVVNDRLHQQDASTCSTVFRARFRRRDRSMSLSHAAPRSSSRSLTGG
jgi:adenylate kinase